MLIGDGDPVRLLQVPHHDGKGLVPAAFTCPQGPHRRIVSGIAGQVEAPQPLHRQDFALAQHLCGNGQNVLVHGLPLVFQPDVGTAGRTGGGFGMKAPVLGIFVLPAAGRTHVEDCHGGLGPVVRYPPDQGKAGTAIGAVGEGIAKPPVLGVADFTGAIIAKAHVRRNNRLGAAKTGAGGNDKGLLPQGRRRFGLHPLHSSQGRGLPSELADKQVQAGRRPLHLDLHPPGGVAHPTRQVMAPGQAIDKGAETHPLDQAGNLELSAGEGNRG